MTKPGITEYHRPDTLDEAFGHVAGGDPSVRLLSGGADLTIHAPAGVTTLVDVSRVLSEVIDVDDDGAVRIGAMATLTDVMEHSVLTEHGGGVIPEMMVHVGNPLLRNFSTIGGHVARGKLSDVVPVLLALDTDIELYDGAGHRMSLSDYYEESRHSRPHVVTGLVIPPLPRRSAAGFLRFAKTVFDFAILNVCCRVDMEDGEVVGARVICGATPRRAERAAGAEAILIERGLTEESIEAAASAAREEIPTGSGWVASAEYRSHLVGVLTARCLTAVAGRLGTS